jgi:hypothetical protein
MLIGKRETRCGSLPARMGEFSAGLGKMFAPGRWWGFFSSALALRVQSDVHPASVRLGAVRPGARLQGMSARWRTA